MKSPGEKNGIESKKTEESGVKKKVRIVKKIVKKKVIKKVPKRSLVAKDNNVVSPNDNSNDLVLVDNKAVVIEKGGNLVVENVKEGEVSGSKKGGFRVEKNVGMEIENLKVVSCREKSVGLVENNDSLMGLEKVASFKGNSNVVMETKKLDVGKKEVEASDSEKSVCLVENDDSLMGLEKVASFKGNSNVVMETKKLDVFDKKKVEASVREKSVCLVGNDDSLMGFEKVASFKGNDNVVMETKKLDVFDKKKVEVSDSEKSVCLVGKDDSLTGLEKVASFKGNSNVVMETKKPEVEASDREKSVCLVENDDSLMGLEKVSSFKGNNNVVMETKKLDDVGKKEVEVNDREKAGVGLVENDDSCSDEREISGFASSSMLGDQDQIQSEDGVNRMDVEEHEGEEEDEKSYEKDVGVSESVKVEASVKEILVNSETNGLKSVEVVSERIELSGEMAASWWLMKQRTKIFIHGLRNETKEEDIRRVFEEVGEVVEVKIITNFRSGKSRGFGFVRFASAELANLALTKLRHVEICGSMCHTAVVEPKDTILLSNIDNKWTTEKVLGLLNEIGITKIDDVSIVPDSENTELNRGFAFVEFETKKDAQMAYRKLQNKNVFGKHSRIKAEWAESPADPVEEEMHSIKSVYAEHLPLSWNEKEVRDHFKMFGEIESIALAKNLWSAKRNDFAFINYKTLEAALLCIEALNSKKSTSYSDPLAQLKVSLAKSEPKGKSTKTIPESAGTESTKVSQKANQLKPYQNGYQKATQSRPPPQSVYHNVSQSKPSLSGYQNASQSRPFQSYLGVNNINMKVSNVSRHEAGRKDEGSSTTNELVQLLREQASWKLAGSNPTAGMSIGHQHHLSGGQQVITELGSRPLYHDPRVYHQTHLQIPNPMHHRQIATQPLPHYDQRRPHHAAGSFNTVEANPSYFQIRDQATYPSSSNIYRRMR